MSAGETTASDLLIWALRVDGTVAATTAEVTPDAGIALQRDAIRDRLLCGGVTATALEKALAQAAEWRNDISQITE